MKRAVLVVAAAAVFTTLGVSTPLSVANAQTPHKGYACSSNPYNPNFAPRCGRGAAAKKHNDLVKRHRSH